MISLIPNAGDDAIKFEALPDEVIVAKALSVLRSIFGDTCVPEVRCMCVCVFSITFCVCLHVFLCLHVCMCVYVCTGDCLAAEKQFTAGV